MVQLSLRFLNLFMVLVAVGAFDFSDQQGPASSSSSTPRSFSSSSVYAAPVASLHGSQQMVHRSDKARVGVVVKSSSSAQGLTDTGSASNAKRMERRRRILGRRGAQAPFKAATSEGQKPSAFKGFEVANKQQQTLSLRRLRHSSKQGNPLMLLQSHINRANAKLASMRRRSLPTKEDMQAALQQRKRSILASRASGSSAASQRAGSLGSSVGDDRKRRSSTSQQQRPEFKFAKGKHGRIGVVNNSAGENPSKRLLGGLLGGVLGGAGGGGGGPHQQPQQPPSTASMNPSASPSSTKSTTKSSSASTSTSATSSKAAKATPSTSSSTKSSKTQSSEDATHTKTSKKSSGKKSAATSSAAVAAASASAASAGFSKAALAAANSNGLQEAATPEVEDSLGLNIEANDVGYVATVQIGSNKLPFKMLIDSGSADTWVPLAPCSACNNHQKLGPSTSTTFKASTKKFSITYGTGDVSGTLGRDDLIIAGLDLKNHTMGVVTKESSDFSDNSVPFDGLMGLAKKQLSNSGKPTPIDSLYSKKLVTAPVMGYHLGRAADDDNDGEVTFGGVDATKYADDLIEIDNVSDEGFWEIPVEGVSFDGKTISEFSNGTQRTAILDTGTTLMVMPTEDADAVHAAIPGSKADGQGGYTIPCTTDAGLSFKFGGKEWPIVARDMVFLPVDESNLKGECVSAISAGTVGGDYKLLLGAAFLKNVYFATNAETNSIGLGVLANSTATASQQLQEKASKTKKSSSTSSSH